MNLQIIKTSLLSLTFWMAISSSIPGSKAISENEFVSHIAAEDRTSNAPACECGISNRKRIVGGLHSLQNSFPWLVTINGNSGHLSCGGALLNNVFILTASHCFIDRTTKAGVTVMTRIKPDEIYVILGDFDRSSSSDAQTVQKAVEEIITHEQYGKLALYDSDIALVRIKGTITFSDSIKPICLPPPKTEYLKKMTTVAGYGKTSYLSSVTSSSLTEIDIPVVNDSICRHNFSRHYTKNMICAGWEEGDIDSCTGDSGGPLMFSDVNYVFEVIGIVSFGVKCAEPGYRGVYTKVVNYLDWIDDKMSGTQKCRKASKNPPSCGVVSTASTPGATANNIKYPWTAAIFAKNSQNSLDIRCEATLISKEWVITSARCVDGYPASSLSVRLGDSDLTKTTKPEHYLPIKEVVIHPNFNSGYDFTNDLALIKLVTKVKLSETVSPICLPTGNWRWNIPEGFEGVNVGLSISPKVKEQHVIMKSKNTTVCQSFYGPNLPLHYYMCTNGTYGKDICDHDFGGHFSIKVKDMYKLTGVQAYGKNFNCTTDYPAVFMSIPYYLQWITVTTGIFTFTA